MASAVNPNSKKEKEKEVKKDTANQLFRRERSFVVQRPSQPPGSNHFQQRERSFIRDGSRCNNNNSTYQSFNSTNRGNQSRAGQQQSTTNASRAKPNMEIYRPPSLRSGEVATAVAPTGNANGNHLSMGNRVQFQSKENNSYNNGNASAAANHNQSHQTSVTPRLTKSRTSLEMHSNSARGMKAAQQQQQHQEQTLRPLQPGSGRILIGAGPRSGSGSGVKVGSEAGVVSETGAGANAYVLQRSKSSGGGTISLQKTSNSANPTDKAAKSVDPLPDLTHFPEHTQNLLRKIATDPDGAASRLVMEAVGKIFNRLIESSRYASPIARYCSYVIEKETKATFLESLLNTCQESFQERDRLLRSSASSQSWVAFINFLNEMYIQLKRMHSSKKGKMRSKRPAELIVLALLAESCCVTLKEPSSHTLQELECLFFVLTGIGRDVESQLPLKMVSIFSCIRDAFLDMNSLTAAAQRTLLQLIELRAAKWQLPATAVTYYYPALSNSPF